MPVKSKKQFKLVQLLRNKYGSKKNAPKKYHWAFEKGWTDVDYQKLPQKVSETKVMKFDEWSEQF